MSLIASDCLPHCRRYGILGQFGPDRKLQLLTTNLSAIVGWDGRLLANASIEMEVFVSNTSHVLHVFEYTKENNVKGVQFLIPQPPGGVAGGHVAFVHHPNPGTTRATEDVSTVSALSTRSALSAVSAVAPHHHLIMRTSHLRTHTTTTPDSLPGIRYDSEALHGGLKTSDDLR